MGTSEVELPLYMASTDENNRIMTMVLGTTEIGRYLAAAQGDISEFDVLPVNSATKEPEGEKEGEILVGDEPFQSPIEEHFPIFSNALQHFQSLEEKPRVVRIDNEDTYGKYISDRAVDELVKRIDLLQTMASAHIADPYAHPHVHKDGRMIAVNRDTILGAIQEIKELKLAVDTGTDAAVDAMAKVPLAVPEWAKGKVKCWRDGDSIVCSIKFLAADGSPRMATMADDPIIDGDRAAKAALNAGVPPAVVLDVLPDLTAASCGKRLMRDCADAALQAQRRLDVCHMDNANGECEPVVLISGAVESRAPLAALMYLQQQAEIDPDARAEYARILTAARALPSGQQVAIPVLQEANKRLALGRAVKNQDQKLLR